MLTVPFAAKLGTTIGAALDGVVYGTVPKVAPNSALSEVHLSPLTKVYRGNADASGGVNWTDVTTAANNDTVSDVSLFDTINPTKDMVCVELSTGDVVSGISLLVSTAATLTGTPVAEVRYRTATGWGTATGIITPSLTSIGLKKVLFNDISYLDITPTDNVLDPFNGGQQRCLYLLFTGITAVTTAPTFTRIWKNMSHASVHKSINYTAAVIQGSNPDFSALQSVILPVTNDLTLMGFNAPIVRLHPTIYRPTAAGLGAREWVYSKSDGSFAAIPAANIQDPSNLFSVLATATGIPWDSAIGVAGVQEFYEPDALLVGELTTWDDLVGTANSLTQTTQTSRPMVVLNAYNGQSTVRFDGTDDFLELPVDRTDVRAVFAVVREDVAAGNVKFLFGDDINYHFHRDQNATKYMIGSGASASVTGGTARINGTVVNMQATPYPTTLGIVSFETTGNVEIGNIGRDRTIAGRNWQGDICEIIILNVVPSQSNRESIEGYLAWKYGLQTSLPDTHPYRYFAQGTAPNPTQININPPADWGNSSMTDTSDVVHTRYWLGWRYTGDTSSPVLPVNFTVRGSPVMGAGIAGIPAPETTTYTTMTVAGRETSAAAETLLLINGTTGKTASVTVPANTAVATATVLLPATKGDNVVLVHTVGSSTNAIGDGAVFLS